MEEPYGNQWQVVLVILLVHWLFGLPSLPLLNVL